MRWIIILTAKELSLFPCYFPRIFFCCSAFFF